MSSTLATAIFWLAAVSCAVAQIALIMSAIRSPMPGSAETAAMPMPRRSSEIAWTIVPAIGLALLLAFTWRAMHPPIAPVGEHTGHSMTNE